MFEDVPPGRQTSRGCKRTRRCGFLSLILLATFAAPNPLCGQATESVAVSRLRRALCMSYPNLAERDRVVKACLAELRTLRELQQAAMLVEWGEPSSNDPAAEVDSTNRARVIDEFQRCIHPLLREGDPARTADALELLRRMAVEARASGKSLAMFGGCAADLADLVIQGPPPLRGAAARTLAALEPPVYVAVPALNELLQAEDAGLRLAAADSLAVLLQNALRVVSEASAVRRPARRGDLVLVASTVLPAIRPGLEDDQREVRHRCLATIDLACGALIHLLDNPLGEEALEARPLEGEAEELRPLLQALRELAPILLSCLHDGDAEMRIGTHKVLEDLGVARSRRMARCPARHEEGTEKLLGELLQEAMPGLAEELQHPDVRVRRSAIDVLETSGSLALPALPALTRALQDPDRFVRWSAIRTVGKLGPTAAPQTIADLARLLRDPDVDLRNAAAHALANLNAIPAKTEERNHE